MKNFLLAVVIAIVLMNGLGSLVDSWFGIDLILSDHSLGPIETMVVLSIVAVLLVIVGFVVALSVVGTLFLAFGAGFIALLAVGIGAFWPVIVIVVVLYALKKRNSVAYKQQNGHNMHHTL